MYSSSEEALQSVLYTLTFCLRGQLAVENLVHTKHVQTFSCHYSMSNIVQQCLHSIHRVFDIIKNLERTEREDVHKSYAKILYKTFQHLPIWVLAQVLEPILLRFGGDKCIYAKKFLNCVFSKKRPFIKVLSQSCELFSFLCCCYFMEPHACQQVLCQ